MPAFAVPQACPRCGFEPESFVAKCPQCGQVILSPKQVRGLGWLMIVCGALLTVGMAVLGASEARIIAHSGDPGATTRFTGDANDATVIFAIFGMVFLFGVFALVCGGWLVWRGRQNLRLVGAMMLFGFLLIAAAWIANSLL